MEKSGQLSIEVRRTKRLLEQRGEYNKEESETMEIYVVMYVPYMIYML